LSNPPRFFTWCARAAAATALVLSPAAAHANGGVLPPSNAVDPSTLDIDVAVAVTPFGTTRWTRLTVGGSSSVMWLVPARPGAAVDWASDGWLTALGDATTPRVAPPSDTPPCGIPNTPERVAAWGTSGTQKFPFAVAVHETLSIARAHIGARGFAASTEVDAKIAEIYSRGYALVSLELDTGGGGTFSTPTLRISDDGGAIVPVALTGSRQTLVHVTATVLSEGPAVLSGAQEIDASALHWGRNYSSWTNARTTLLLNGGGAQWLRESASHDVLFNGVPLPRSSPIQPLTSGYFREANGQTQPTCDTAALAAASAAGTIGRTCAPGTLARVPGGTACTPTNGPIDPAAFTCGSGVDDLALALSGASPSKAYVSRFTGVVARNTIGSDWSITTGGSLSPLVFAGQYEPCPVPVTPPGGSFTPPPAQPVEVADDRPYHYDRNSGCTGSSTVIIYEDTGEEAPVADEGCGGSSTSSDTGTTTSTGDDGDNCGSSSTSSSSSSSGSSDDDDSDDDDSGWDTDDDDTSSSSDSSSDSCECGKSSTGSSSSSSGDSDSDWDESEATPRSLKIGPPVAGEAKPQSVGQPKGKAHGKQHHKKKKAGKNLKGRGPSPVSRYALVFVALILPLRRRFRVNKF
jgi:hypothetical protein